jgi:hypothetical protein
MTRAAATICFVSSLLLGASTPAAAHRRHAPPEPRPLPFETYTSFKAGAYSPDALRSEGAGDGGLFLGMEWGLSPTAAFEIGATIDWFHRESAHGSVVVVDGPFDLPVEVVTGEATSTDLVPVGGVVRARFPLSGGRVSPFVAGHLSYDVLHLQARSASWEGEIGEALRDTNWFGGWGAGLSAGVEALLAPGFGLLLEAGLHESEPGQSLTVGGLPAEARVKADGDFLRAGARFAF